MHESIVSLRLATHASSNYPHCTKIDFFQEGRIFIADYTTWTRGLPRNKRYKSDKMLYCCDCLALYYSPGDGRFLPIAIQLKPDDENYVFTPHDAKYDWMLAKMFFRCSDTNAHQVS